VGEDSSIEQHLRAGQDRLARIGEAVAAFRRLSPADYGHFLATIEADLDAGAPALGGGASPPLLLTGPAEETRPARSRGSGSGSGSGSGTLREAVLAMLADGLQRSTTEIRRDLEGIRPVKPATLNTEIFTLRKMGLLHSEGQGRGRRHTLVPRAPAVAATRSVASARKREPATRAVQRKGKRDDDEDHPGRGREASPDAERIYASVISDHHLLTKDEELELARRLEDVEGALWERLLGGPLASEARQLLLALDPPVVPAGAREARAADLDRRITSRVIAKGAEHLPTDDRLAGELAELRALAAEADRIRVHFATCNLRMVPSTIRRHGYHLTTSLAMSDLIQEGNCGLLKAIPRFDYRRGLRFSTFATWWIRHYLVRARQNLGAEVRVPVHLQELAGKVRRAKVSLRGELGRDPNQDELARALKVSKKSLRSLEADWPKYREALPSFDSVGDQEGVTPSYLASEEALADEVLASRQEDDRIASAVACMPPLLAQIVRRRFGLGGVEQETLIQIGDSMQLSRERIRQLEKKALTVLRQAIGEIPDVAA
jgi:RNA polymerase primary sigma factor